MSSTIKGWFFFSSPHNLRVATPSKNADGKNRFFYFHVSSDYEIPISWNIEVNLDHLTRWTIVRGVSRLGIYTVLSSNFSREDLGCLYFLLP